MSDEVEVRVAGTLSPAEKQALIARSIQHVGEPDNTPDSLVLPVVVGAGVVAVLVLFFVLRDASIAAALGCLLIGLVAGYMLGLRRVGAVGTPIVGWSFRADGARDHYESGGYLFHPWQVLTVVHAEWGLLAAADKHPVVYVPARLLPDRVDVAHIVALAEAGGAEVREEL